MNTTPNTLSTPAATFVAPTRNRFNPLGWSRPKQLTAALVVATVAVGGWALFRPEKLFINTTINESFPTTAVAGQSAHVLLGSGDFKGLGHHTEGRALLYQQGSKNILRLGNGFSTSNGPDVRVYLVEGKDGGDNAAIKAGKILDMGVIKANIGDQNYTLPAGFDAGKYQSVSIWCKRFGVNFASAALASGGAPQIVPVAAKTPTVATASAASTTQTKPIVVTTGAFQQTTHATSGTATISEDSSGNRTLALKGFKTGQGPKLHLYLYDAEAVKTNADAKKLVAAKKFIDLGALKSTGGAQTFIVPKNIDLWEFLSVGVWCDQFDVQFGSASLSAPRA